MGERTPQTVLERVARLEIENAALAARIARIRADGARADTVSTRRPRASRPAAFGVGVAFALCGTMCGLALGLTCPRTSPRTAVAAEPPPAIDPLPPTPPVYAVPPPRAPGLRVRAGSSR